MKDIEVLNQLLAIEYPWQIIDVRCDGAGRRIDIRVGMQPARGWFSRSRAVLHGGETRIWRHLGLSGWRCFIHAPAQLGGSSDTLLWCGGDGMPFTNAMAREVGKLLLEGLKFPAICKLLDVQVADVWKFKHGLDSGRTGLSTVQPLPMAAAVETPQPSSHLPDLADPVWERLLDGSLDIDIRVLSLKLLLSKLREHMRTIDDLEVRRLKVHEMYRYCARHEQVLGHELAQLRAS